jgi:hypothetical protein
VPCCASGGEVSSAAGVDVVKGEDDAVDGGRRMAWDGGAATVGDFGTENGYMQRILEENEINGRELPFLSPTPRARSPFHAFLFHPESPSAPRKAGDGLG